jgi:hypothetical protein
MDRPATVTESSMWAVVKMLDLPEEYGVGLRKERERLFEMLKVANMRLTLYRSWQKQRSLDSKMPVPDLSFLFQDNSIRSLV